MTRFVSSPFGFCYNRPIKRPSMVLIYPDTWSPFCLWGAAKYVNDDGVDVKIWGYVWDVGRIRSNSSFWYFWVELIAFHLNEYNI